MQKSHWKTFSQWFWDEERWFPPISGWNRVPGSEDDKFPYLGDLICAFYCAVAISLIRIAFERFFAFPLGRRLGIKDSLKSLKNFKNCESTAKTEPIQNGNLKNNQNGNLKNGFAHHQNGTLKAETEVKNITGNGTLKAETEVKNITGNGTLKAETEVKNITGNGTLKAETEVKNGTGNGNGKTCYAQSKLRKFVDCSWRCFYFLIIFHYGIIILWNKPWFSSTAACWTNYPWQPIDPEVWWYYMIQAGFYWSTIFSLFWDVRRKDFFVQIVHHFATIILIYFSWADNFVRVGTLVFVVHDAVDYWMEFAKISRYCNKDKLCNMFFVIFVVVWFATRLGIYPFRILYSTLIEIRYIYAVATVRPSLNSYLSSYYTFNALLLTLFTLHLFWTRMILKILINSLIQGEVQDVRSDDEDEDEDVKEPRSAVKKLKSS